MPCHSWIRLIYATHISCWRRVVLKMRTLLCSCMMTLQTVKKIQGQESLLIALMGRMFTEEFPRYVYFRKFTIYLLLPSQKKLKIYHLPNTCFWYYLLRQDYTGDDVTVNNFLAALLGNKTALTGGSGKVVDSGPDDHIFIFYSDHGGAGVLGEWLLCTS